MILVNSMLYDKAMTSPANQVNEFCVLIPSMRTNHLRTIAITHKQFPLDLIGTLHIAPEERHARIEHLKTQLQINELVYISTCNRVEFVFTLDHYVCPGFTQNFLQTLFPLMEKATAGAIAGQCERYNEAEAMEHLLRVSSSLDSMVIGEREIITQMRLSYEDAEKHGWAGDQLRLAWKQILKTSKEIYTHTDLAKKPVSVASLAWQNFLQVGLPQDARIMLIGAGQIIRNLHKFLFENNYKNVIVVNRSEERGMELANQFGSDFLLLDELPFYNSGCDAIMSCTASEQAILNLPLFESITEGQSKKVTVIDLALPADVDASVAGLSHVHYIDMLTIQEMAKNNIAFREQAITACEAIIDRGMKEFEKLRHERQVEVAMQEIPLVIKNIRETAVGSVFAKDLEQLDEQSLAILEKVMAYMEKKYISVPMKMAKEVLLQEVSRN
jgi:glutamyl-tRNA reductase